MRHHLKLSQDSNNAIISFQITLRIFCTVNCDVADK